MSPNYIPSHNISSIWQTASDLQYNNCQTQIDMAHKILAPTKV